MNCQTKFDVCTTATCWNNGVCTAGINTYTCNCSTTGYTGVNCQTNINECHSNLCLHNSTCIDGINTYKCNCTNGYTGQKCETDFNECQSSPCQHNGHCRNTVGSFYCNCTATGYSGPLCDTGMAVLAAMSMSIFSTPFTEDLYLEFIFCSHFSQRTVPSNIFNQKVAILLFSSEDDSFLEIRLQNTENVPSMKLVHE